MNPTERLQVALFDTLERESNVFDGCSSKEEVCGAVYEALFNVMAGFSLANKDEESLATLLETGTKELVAALRDGTLRAITNAIEEEVG